MTKTTPIDWRGLRFTPAGELLPVINGTERALSQRFRFTHPGADWADGAWLVEHRADGSSLWVTFDGAGWFLVIRPAEDPETGERPDDWTETLLADADRPALVRRWLRAGCPIPLAVAARKY